MRRRLFVATLALAGSVLALPGRADAQGPSPEEAATRLRLGAGVHVAHIGSTSAPRLIVLPDSVVSKGKNYTVIGLLIGAGIGFAGGWVFYDTLCEAVDNKCGDSRVGHLVIGSAAGAALGALIGSLAD